MAWVAVDKNGEELVYCKEPCKDKEYWYSYAFDNNIQLPSGTIKKLIGSDLSWDDEPVELT